MFYYDTRLAWIATALTALRGVLIVSVSAVRLHHERRHVELRGKVEGFVLQLLTGVGKLRVACATIRALAVWGKRFAAQKRHFVVQREPLRQSKRHFRPSPHLCRQRRLRGIMTLDVLPILALAIPAAFGEWAAIRESLIAVPYFSRSALWRARRSRN